MTESTTRARAVTPEAATSGARPGRVPAWLRGVLRWLGVVPFGMYIALGLAAPTIAIAVAAFRSSSTGAATMRNITTALHGTYLLGLKTSILLSIDLKTMVEASNSLGAGWGTTLWRVVLPNIRTAMLSATVLTVALVLGEFTMASLDLYVTFPVWIVQFEQNSGPVSVAASLLALFVTWILLMFIVALGGRSARSRGGAQVALFSVARQDFSQTRGEPE
jgi:hypothetical protein